MSMRTTPTGAGRLQKYGIALLAAGLAFAASYVTWPLLKSTPWVFFFTAIIVSAWFGGQGPSLVTAAVLTVLGRYFFIRPLGEFTLNRDSLVSILVFNGVSLFIGYVASARRRAEGHERAERRRFQATVTSIGDAVIATDSTGRVVFMNGVAEEMTGWSMPTAAGKRLGEVFVIVQDDTRAPAPNPVESLMETGRSPNLTNQTLLIARDGSERPIDDSTALIRDDRGEATGVVLVFRDIRERLEAERLRQELTAQIAAQARIFDTALSNAADFIYTFDLEGRFTYINRALLALLRKNAAEVVGKNFFDLGYPHDLAARLQRQIQEVITSKSQISDETPFTSALGTRHYEYIFVPVLGPNGSVEAVAGSTRDVTERKELEEATRRRAEQLQKLAEIATRINAAHDVSSVVAVVTEEARNLLGARRSATSLVLNSLHPRILNIVSPATNWAHPAVSASVDGRELDEAMTAENQSVRLTQNEWEHDPRWRTLDKLALALPTSNEWLAAPLVGRGGRSTGSSNSPTRTKA